MSKGLGVVIAGIILSVAGIALAGACYFPASKDFDKLGNMVEGELTLKEKNKLSIEMSAGTINIMHSETETSYVKYNGLGTLFHLLGVKIISQ